MSSYIISCHIHGDFMAHEMVPDTYDYTKLFGLWKGKGNKLDLNINRYIHGKNGMQNS